MVRMGFKLEMLVVDEAGHSTKTKNLGTPSVVVMHGDGGGDEGGQNQTSPQIAEKGPNDFSSVRENICKRGSKSAMSRKPCR